MATISSQYSTFTPDNLLRTQYDHRSTFRKIVDLVISIFREVKYSLTVLYYRLFGPNPQLCGQKIEWSPESQGLVVLLHGLCNDPSAWYSQLSLLQRYPRIDVFAPVVPKRGMCSLEEAALPILPTLLDYSKKNAGKPLCLLGVSNGSRIVTWLETKMRHAAPDTPVMVSTIAGVHLGSRQMDLLENWGIGCYFYPEAIRRELKYDSPTARELLDRVRAPLPKGCAPRNYAFYASTDDFAVPDLDSSLPRLDKGESTAVVHGESHDSIVSAVAEKQISSCLDWMKITL